MCASFNLLGKYNFPNISEFHMFCRATLQISEELFNILVGIFPNVPGFLGYNLKFHVECHLHLQP